MGEAWGSQSPSSSASRWDHCCEPWIHSVRSGLRAGNLSGHASRRITPTLAHPFPILGAYPTWVQGHLVYNGLSPNTPFFPFLPGNDKNRQLPSNVRDWRDLGGITNRRSIRPLPGYGIFRDVYSNLFDSCHYLHIPTPSGSTRSARGQVHGC